MNKPIVNRKCLITNNLYPREKLIRLVYVSNQLVIEPKPNNKGLYILNDLSVLDVIKNKKLLEKHLRRKINNYEQISAQLIEIMEAHHG